MHSKRKIPGKIRIPHKVVFLITGLVSTVWFLIRVIPKPSRAAYPCMRVAAPFMSGFVIYILSVTGSVMLFKRTRRLFFRARYILAAGAFLTAVALFIFSSHIFPERLLAAASYAEPSDFPANQPMGEGLGIFPGRVVWEWDPDATDENCTNTRNDPIRGEDGYFLAKNSNQEVIDQMMANIVMKLSGSSDIKSAWDMLFTDFNKRKGVGEVTYQAVRCYPNHFRDMVYLETDLPSGYAGPATIQVCNMAGALIWSRSEDHFTGGEETLIIDLSGEPAGSYLFTVIAGEEQHTVLMSKMP